MLQSNENNGNFTRSQWGTDIRVSDGNNFSSDTRGWALGPVL